PQWGCGGRWFESSRPDHLLQQERTLDWVRTSEAGLPATARQRKFDPKLSGGLSQEGRSSDHQSSRR
ncbi:MAG: hypothetical protein P1U85_08930, partial [Verrucomicrobiales bacterium]|nr:hypothetical protein [Verrucomicrobiales bacterium]